MLRNGRVGVRVAFFSSCLTLAAPALLAQISAVAQTPTPDVTLEEVIVTAEKRTEDLRKVPVSITVLSAADIADQHMLDVADLTRSVPNLSFSTQGGEGNQNIELRGISSTAGSSTVAVYLDDVSLTVRNLDTQGQVEPNFFDISRVEVLRGPQGTLYGASAEGGAIRYVSNPVNLNHYEGDAYGEVSDTKHGSVNYLVRGVLNMPLIANQLGVRAGVSVLSDSGYIDHDNPDQPSQLLARGVNGDRAVSARLQLEWQPAPGTSVKPAVLYQRYRSDDLDVLDLGSPDLLSQHKRVAEPGVDELTVPSVTFNFDAGAAELTSISSYFYRDFHRTVDGTFYNSGYIGQTIDAAGITGLDGNLDGYLIGNVASPVFYNIRTQQFTEELRLASRPYSPGQGLPISWIAGLFYSDQKVDSRDFERAPGLNQALQTVYGAGFNTSAAFLQALGNPAVPVFPNDIVYLNNKLYNERQEAIFGEATWHITNALRASAGLRFVEARTSLLRIGEYYFATGSPPALQVVDHGRPVTPRFVLAYDFTADTDAYLSASKGFRLGGPNRPLPSFCPHTPASYDPDSLWNYEAGVKTLALDQRLAVSADVFYINWKNIQVDINLPCTFDYNTNAGSARSYGSELELRYKLTRSLELATAAGYTHATLTQDVASLGITAGQDVPGAPRWSGDVSARHSRPIDAHVTGFATADWNYVGASHGTVGVTDPDYNRPSYAVFGMTSGIALNEWRFSLFGKNLFNDQKIIQRPNLQTVNRGYTLTPRTIGLSLERSF